VRRRITILAVVLGLILCCLSAIIGYRVRAADEALEYLPSSATPVVLLPGTSIEAVMLNAFDASAGVGDSVVALVSRPVVINDRVVIPSGARFLGTLQAVSIHKEKANATIRFGTLAISGMNFDIQTEAVRVTTPVHGDLEIMRTALEALMGATLGGTFGAESNDPLMIRRGMVEGMSSSISAKSPVSFTVTLTRDLHI
jgi:hypothetical protein